MVRLKNTAIRQIQTSSPLTIQGSGVGSKPPFGGFEPIALELRCGMNWMNILVGVFTGAVVAYERRWPLLWLWGISFVVMVGTFAGGMLWWGGLLWRIVPLVTLAVVLVRHPDTVRARLMVGGLSVLGCLVAVVVALSLSALFSVGGGLEQVGVVILNTVLIAVPVGAAAGWLIAQRIATRQTRG